MTFLNRAIEFLNKQGVISATVLQMKLQCDREEALQLIKDIKKKLKDKVCLTENQLLLYKKDYPISEEVLKWNTLSTSPKLRKSKFIDIRKPPKVIYKRRY